MIRPSRRVLVVLSCAVAGVLAAGAVTAVAYAGSPSRDSGGIYGCVQQRTGVLRVVDPARGQSCRTGRGYFQEYAVTLSQAAALPGPTGPRGPRGPAGDGIDSLDALEGLPCNVDSEDEGQVVIRIAPPERGSTVQMICETDRTSTYAPAPPTTVSPPATVDPPATTRPPIDEGTPDPVPPRTPPPRPTPSTEAPSPPPPAA